MGTKRRFRKGFTEQLADEVKNAAQEVADLHGMTASLNSARANQGAIQISLRISINNTHGLTYEQEQFEVHCIHFDIPKEWLGRRLWLSSDPSRVYEVYGWQQRSKKYKVLLMDQEGRINKTTPNVLKDRDFVNWID
jgi:hypothetical protein